MLSPLLISALSDLLDQDSEMQRALGVADSFDSASTNQAPSCRFFTLLLNILFTPFLVTSPQNGRTLPSCETTFLRRARWVVD